MERLRNPILFFFFLIWALMDFSPVHCRTTTLVETLAQLSLEELLTLEVSSTTFFDMPPEKAPGSLYWVSSDQLDHSYVSSLGDVLRYFVPGVHLSEGYSAGPLSSTRGIASSSNSTTLFMLDGHSMNVSNGMGINTNLDLPLLGYVDRVEVLNGPCSIIHGSGAINGFVNVIPKNGRDHPGGFVNVDTAFPTDLIKAETGYGWRSYDKGDFFIYAGVAQADGIEEKDVLFDALPEANSRFSIHWQKETVRLTALVQDETVESPLKSRSFGQEYAKVAMKSVAILPEMEFPLTDTEAITMGLPIQYFEYKPDYLNPYGSDSGQDVSNLDSEFHITSNLLLKSTRFSGHQFAMGGALRFQRFQSDTTLINTPLSEVSSNSFDNSTTQSLDLLNIDIEWLETSLFLEDYFQISPSVTIFGGLRYDALHPQSFELSADGVEIEYDGASEDIMTTRLGLTWDLGGNRNIKLIYQEGYHYPGYVNFISYAGPEDPFSVEEVMGYELGYHHSFMENRYRFSLNFYYNIFENTQFLFTPDERASAEISDDSIDAGEQGSSDEDDSETFGGLEISERFVAAGFEAGFHVKLDDDTWVDLSYGLSNPHQTEASHFIKPLTDLSGDHWKGYPEHMVKFNMGRQMLDGRLAFTLGGLYSSPIQTVKENSEILGETQRERSDDLFDHHRWVINMGIRYQLSERLALTFKGENLFNNDVPATGFYYDVLNREYLTLEEPVYTLGVRWMF